MTVEERLVRLEKSLIRWRGATIALIGVAAVALVCGADTTSADLKVKSLTVVGDKGNGAVLGRLSEGGFGLKVFKRGENGKDQIKSVSLEIDLQERPSLFLLNEAAGKTLSVVQIVGEDNVASFSMRSELPEGRKGEAMIFTNSKEGKPRILLEQNDKMTWGVE